MANFTTNTYTLKRKILTFTNKISKLLSKPERKFTADITYGMLAAESCLLTDVVDQLHEDSKKKNIVDRLSRHLEKGISDEAVTSYLQVVKKLAPSEPVIHIDDSDVVKPDGYKFESLGIVRDGSESTLTKNVYQKGYHVTEACVLTNSNHPVSIFSHIHSSIITSGSLPLNCAIVAKVKLKLTYSTKEKTIMLIFPTSKYRLPPPEKLSILCWFTVLQNIR